MNNTRRKEIARIRGQLEELSAKLSELHGDIDNVLSEEQEAFDAMPESLQERRPDHADGPRQPPERARRGRHIHLRSR